MATKKKAAPKKAKAKKEKKPKKQKQSAAPGIGHNSRTQNPKVKAAFAKWFKLDAQKKALGLEQRDIKAQMKSEFSISASVFAHECRLQKLDNEARVEFEHGHTDLKKMLGVQMAFDYDTGVVVGSDGKTSDEDPEAAAAKEAGEGEEEEHHEEEAA